MSRTWKDQPIRVFLKKNAEKDLIDHSHHYLPVREGYSSWKARDLSCAFWKKDTSAIREYEEYLKSYGDEIQYEIVERENLRNVSFENDYFEISYTEKTVEFVVYRWYSYTASNECFSLEHYDFFTHKDSRTGKRSRCTPRWTEDIPASYSKARKNEPVRSSVRQELHNVKKTFNAGALDEDYSNELVEQRYGRKVWTWDD